MRNVSFECAEGNGRFNSDVSQAVLRRFELVDSTLGIKADRVVRTAFCELCFQDEDVTYQEQRSIDLARVAGLRLVDAGAITLAPFPLPFVPDAPQRPIL